MTLTQALKKSNIVRRASAIEDVYKVDEENRIVKIDQGDDEGIIWPFTVDELSATDWQAAVTITKWIGSGEKKGKT